MTNLNVESVFTLIEQGYGWATEEYIDNFHGLDGKDKELLKDKLNKAGMLIKEPPRDLPAELSIVNEFLLEATQYGLQAEVVYWALKAMKEDPKLSIQTAMYYGLTEWVK